MKVKPVYHMVTAQIQGSELIFNSDQDFQTAIKDGFFRIKTPDDLDLSVGREFARTFIENERYTQFGKDAVGANGFLTSERNQTIRFSLASDYWEAKHPQDGQPNYPDEIRAMGKRMHDIGQLVLKNILNAFEIPEEAWYEATAGSVYGEGSHFLLFNNYDPKNGDKPDGVAKHRDWSFVTVLDATEPGLQAKINGKWHDIFLADGFLTVNFGHTLQELLPGVNASLHRVIPQTLLQRISCAAFLDGRVGPFNQGTQGEGREGHVYRWDAPSRSLVEGEPITSYFTRLSEKLYGKAQ